MRRGHMQSYPEGAIFSPLAELSRFRDLFRQYSTKQDSLRNMGLFVASQRFAVCNLVRERSRGSLSNFLTNFYKLQNAIS